MRASSWQFSYRLFQFFLFEVMVIDASSRYFPTHNIVPHISWHDSPYRKTTKKYEDLPSKVVFRFTEIRDSNMVLQLSTISLLISHCLWVHPKFSWSRKDVGSPKSTSLLSTFHIGSMFCFFPANFMSSTYTDKNNPFSLCTNKHSQLETFSQPCFKRIFSNCLSHNSPAKGWRYRFRSRRTTGSSTLDHDLGHLCRGRRILMSGHSEFGNFQSFWSIFHFYLGISRYCIRCLSITTWQSGDDIHDFFGSHFWCWWSFFCEYGIRSGIILNNIACILQMTNVHQWDQMNFSALRPCFIDHLSFVSDFCQVPRRNLVQFLTFFIHCCFCCGYLHCFEA